MIIDIGIIFALVAIFYFITLKKGKRFVLSTIFSFYITILISKYLLIDTAYVTDNALLVSFAVILILSFVGVSRYIKNHKSDIGGWQLGTLLLSLSATILLLTSYFHFLPENFWAFSDQIRDLFYYSDNILGIVFTIPLVSLFIAAKDD